jgi:bifunctional non-homologous end joining protein LigD
MPRFQLLQSRINLTRGADIARIEAEVPAIFFVFDILYLDGYDLHGVPLRDRKELLQANVPGRDNIRLVSYFEDKGSEIAAAARELGFEGVVGKRVDSRYESGVRSKVWVKVKTVREQEFVVGGYTPGEGARSKSFGALALGYYDDGTLRYAGNVGSGFNDGQLSTVFKNLDELKTDKSPFAEKIEGKMTWTRPEMVVQVKYGEWTNDNRLRAPVFLGLRTDVDPMQVRRETPASAAAIEAGSASDSSASSNGSDSTSEVEAVLRQLENPKANFNVQVEGESIKLTNLDKEFWPEYEGRPPLSKRELAKYYVKVAPVLLPHLKDRPLTLTRYPNGVMAKPFYQKHYDQPIPSFVETVMIWSEHTASDGEYIVCNNLPTLVWLSQLADLELHAWMARVDPEPDAHGTTRDFAGSERTLETSALNYPDFMVFDLDPYIYSGRESHGEEPEYNKRGWEKTVEIALSLKDLLDQLRLSSFVKTTGKTGIHIYVPILRHYDYDTVRVATQTLGRFLIQQHPKDVTMEWDTSKRRGKIFFDANQNTRGKTLAAQYSLRPTPWAGVSMPVAWSDLASVDPVSFNILNAPERIGKVGDVWADILSRKNDLGPLLSG